MTENCQLRILLPQGVFSHSLKGFLKNGSCAQMEKKEYALDAEGNRIPEIDPKTGQQKVRVRTRNGSTSTEKLWKRVTVQANDWNKKAFLVATKAAWAEHCNRYLEPQQHIDHRSYGDRDINRVPMVHEGPEARAALERGVVFDCIQENLERKEINRTLERLERFLQEARKLLALLREQLNQRRREREAQRSRRATPTAGGIGAADFAVPGAFDRSPGRAGEIRPATHLKENADALTQRTEKIRRHRHRH